ncbi:MAG: dihydropteroate synthase [Coriobacteriia bacterium]|nr:dihydropteroate synthase [Coriobacteriia bacterium]
MAHNFIPHVWMCGERNVVINRCLIMGVINVTPDSFSDGGSHNNPQDAIAWGKRLLDEGADILDIGGESTRPGSSAVDVEEELRRVMPVIEGLLPTGALLSIDTRHAQVAKKALEAGVHIINDISGFRSPEMRDLAAQTSAGLIIMHMQGEVETMQRNPQYEDVISEIKSYLLGQAKLLESQGVDPQRIMIDPGPGFGKTTAHDLEIQSRFEEFTQLAYPVMEAPSRKRYQGDLTGIKNAQDRDGVTAAQCLLAAYKGAHAIRVHNVKASYDALMLLDREEKEAYIALGANKDQASGQIYEAIEAISSFPLTKLLAQSSLYKSAPAYLEEQDDFTNAVIKVSTKLSPLVLLDRLLGLEDSLGRVREIKNGPRSIDIDLIAYEGERHFGDKLVLPHPKAFERDFVIEPLAEIVNSEQRLSESETNEMIANILGTSVLEKSKRLGQIVSVVDYK